MLDAVSMIVTNLNIILQVYKLLTKVNFKGSFYRNKALRRISGSKREEITLD
jgi:hypothetical protein